MEASRLRNNDSPSPNAPWQSLWWWLVSLLFHVLHENTILRTRVEGMERELQDIGSRLEHLEARIKQDSSNSSRPPSSDSPFKPKPAAKRTGKPGARTGHPGHRQKLLKPNHIHPVAPEACCCGCTQFDGVSAYQTHQEIELPEIQMDVTHFILYLGTCSQCGKVVRARIPKGHETGYGPRLTAFIAETSMGNSRGRVQLLCHSVLGISISRGGIQRCIDRACEAILPYYEAIATLARKAKVNFIDETPWFQKGILMWLWVMVNHEVAFFKIQTSRSKEAFEALVDKWAGILVSDGYGVYRNWLNKRQTCLAHLMRRAKGLSQRANAEMVHFGVRSLAELERLIAWAHAPPTKGDASMWFARLTHLIKTHRDRKDEAGRFARHLERELGHLWIFLLEEGVEATNNRAERSIRFAVLWRKMMQGTGSDKGDRWVERILSLKETCRLKEKSTYEVLVHATSCYFQGIQPDLAWLV